MTGSDQAREAPITQSWRARVVRALRPASRATIHDLSRLQPVAGLLGSSGVAGLKPGLLFFFQQIRGAEAPHYPIISLVGAAKAVPVHLAISSALLVLSFFTLGQLAAAENRCGAGKDLVVQALERVPPGSNASTMQDGVELLKHAIGECENLGDAWYYRSLLERKLGNARKADYSLQKARDNNSEALQQNLDPFTLSTRPNVPPSSTVRDKWALVVGIGKFKQPEIDSLKYAAADATAFAAWLKNPAYGRFKADHVVTLTDSQATTVAIKEKLNWLARSAAADDLVVIYIATHGSSREMDTRGVNYIITYDTEVGKNMDNEDALFATALPMVDVANTVASRVEAQRAAIFVDTCYGAAAAGGGTKLVAPGVASASVSNETLSRITQSAGRVVMAASTANQESLEDSTLGHGYFTYYLLDGLRKNQGLDPIAKIYPYVRQQVEARAEQKWKMQQTPVMSQSDQGGEIVIGVASGAGSSAKGG